MNRSGTAIGIVVCDLLQDVGAAFGLDLISRFLDQAVTAIRRDFRIDGVFHMIDRGLDAHRVIRVKLCRDDFLFERFEPFTGFFEDARHFVG